MVNQHSQRKRACSSKKIFSLFSFFSFINASVLTYLPAESRPPKNLNHRETSSYGEGVGRSRTRWEGGTFPWHPPPPPPPPPIYLYSWSNSSSGHGAWAWTRAVSPVGKHMLALQHSATTHVVVTLCCVSQYSIIQYITAQYSFMSYCNNERLLLYQLYIV